MKKIGKIVLLSTSLVFSGAVTPYTPWKAEAASVLKLANISYQSTGNVYMRKGPSVKNQIIVMIPKSKIVMAFEQTGNWYRSTYQYMVKGKKVLKTGWVSGSYLQKVITAKPPAQNSQKFMLTTYQTTESLNLRSGASTNNKILATISNGKIITSSEKVGNWYKVVYSYTTNGKTEKITGWVNGAYLKEYYLSSTIPSTYYFTTGTVNLYANADKKNKAIFSVGSGNRFVSTIQVMNSIGETWYQITYDGKKLYVYSGDVMKYTLPPEEKLDTPTDFIAVTDGILRIFPDDASNLLSTIPKNTKLTSAYITENGWYKVSYNGMEGYINGATLQKVVKAPSLKDEVPIAKATYLVTEGVNLRQGSDKGTDSLGVIPKGTIVIPMSMTSDNWYKVTYGGKTGYVYGDFIQQVITGDPMGNRDSYQFIDLRTHSTVTADQIDNYIAKYEKDNDKKSILHGMGKVFIDTSNKYGLNALYLAAHAIHESAFGTSAISIAKNNLFGFGAYDAAPYMSSYRFASVEDCIDYIAREIKSTYLNPSNWKYQGPYLGFSTKTMSNARIDENSEGMNFYYASDPNWGKAIAQHMENILHYDKTYYAAAKADTSIPARPTVPVGSDLFPTGIVAISKDSSIGIPKGQSFFILEKTNDYRLRVNYAGKEFWINNIKFSSYSNYLSVQNLGRVTIDGLSVRTGPSTEYAKISNVTLPLNDLIQIAIQQDGTLAMDPLKSWYQVELANGTTGWVSAAFIYSRDFK